MKFFTANIDLNDDKKTVELHYNSTIDMNQCIIKNWNYNIGNSDEVYIIGGVGDFSYLNELKGKKYLLLNDKDMNFYKKYINSVSTIRKDKYDREMFKIYCKNKYDIKRISFDGSVKCKSYTGRIYRMTTHYDDEIVDKEVFNLVGNIGKNQKLFSNGVNVDISVNGMVPLSEIDIEKMIKEELDKLYV